MLLYEILKEFRYWIKVVALGQHTVFNPLVVQDKTANNRKQFFNSIAYLDERSNHDRVLSRGAISTVDDATYRIAQLNEDLLIMVLEYLDMKSLIRVSAVCSVLYHVSHHNLLWIQWLDLERSLFSTTHRRGGPQQQQQQQQQQNQQAADDTEMSDNTTVLMADFRRKFEKLCTFYRPTKEEALYYQFRRQAAIASNGNANYVDHETNLTSWIHQFNNNIHDNNNDALDTEAINAEDADDDTIDNLDFDDVVHDAEYGDDDELNENLELDQIRIRHSRRHSRIPVNIQRDRTLQRISENETVAVTHHNSEDLSTLSRGVVEADRPLFHDNLTISRRQSDVIDSPSNDGAHHGSHVEDRDGISLQPVTAMLEYSKQGQTSSATSPSFIANKCSPLVAEIDQEGNTRTGQTAILLPFSSNDVVDQGTSPTEANAIYSNGDHFESSPVDHVMHGRWPSDLPLLLVDGDHSGDGDDDVNDSKVDEYRPSDSLSWNGERRALSESEITIRIMAQDNEDDTLSSDQKTVLSEIGNSGTHLGGRQKKLKKHPVISPVAAGALFANDINVVTSMRSSVSVHDDISIGNQDPSIHYSLSMADTEKAHYWRRRVEYYKAYVFFRRRKLRNPYIRSRLMKAYVLEQKRKYNPITKWINHSKLISFALFFLTMVMLAFRLDQLILFPLIIILIPLAISASIAFLLNVLLWTPTLNWPLALYRSVGKDYVGCWVSWAYTMSVRGRFVQLVVGCMLTAVPTFMSFVFLFPNFIPPWAPLVVIVAAFVIWSYTATQFIYTPAKGLYSWLLVFICFSMVLFALFMLTKILFDGIFDLPWFVTLAPLALTSIPIIIGHMKLAIQLSAVSVRHGVCVMWNLAFLCMMTLCISSLVLLMLSLDKFVRIPNLLAMCPLFFVWFTVTVYYFLRAFFPSVVRQQAFKNPFTILISGGVKNNSDMESFIV